MADNNAATAKVLDFTNVKDGGDFNTKRVPAGDYEAKITKVLDTPTKKKDDGSGGDPQWTFVIVLTKKHTDRKFPYRCKLDANQLWKIRNVFLAAGKAIPKAKVRLNPNLVVNKIVGISLDDDEYNGKLQSVITQVFPASELEDAGDTDETDFDDTEDDEDDEEEPEPAPRRTAKKKAAPAPEPEDEEDEELDDEEDEEEEPAPPAKAKIPAQRKTSPAAKKRAAKPVQVDDDELEELDLEDI